jgi:TIGR03009 family protein
MRKLWFALAGLVLGNTVLLAQTPPPAADPSQGKLDEVLLQWEKAMNKVASLHAVCKRITLDKTYQTTERFKGYAKYVKAGGAQQPSRAALYLEKEDNAKIFEKLVFTGNTLYEYSVAHKLIRVHELPPAKPGQVADDNIIAFLFGMKAADAKNRYHITYVPPPANDKWYSYLKIQPRHAADKADFSEARLVLFNTTFLPRQFWFLQPNGNEVTYDFPTITSPANIPADEFATPRLPSGWQFARVPRESQPRVVRPSNP